MNGILLSCQIENLTTRKDRSVKITLGTQELSQGKAGEVFQLMNQIAAVYISPKSSIGQNEIDQVDKVNPEFSGKTQSQRIRGTLFKLYEQSNEGHKTFEAYYHAKTEMYIEHLKAKFNP